MTQEEIVGEIFLLKFFLKETKTSSILILVFSLPQIIPKISYWEERPVFLKGYVFFNAIFSPSEGIIREYSLPMERGFLIAPNIQLM